MAEYIGRNAAIEAVKHAWAKGLEPSQYIEALPVADVAPVVHGRWIYDKKAQRPYCSVCKEYFYGATNSSMSYCSNCGAKMDGGADHETD